METIEVKNHSDAFEKWAEYAQKNGTPNPLSIRIESQKWIVEFCKEEDQYNLVLKNHADKIGIGFIASPEILDDCYNYFTSHSFNRSDEKPDNNAFSVVVSKLGQ